MKESEEKIGSINEQKQRIRDRYKGVDPDSLDVIPALPQEDFYKTENMKRVAVYARVSTDDPRQTSSYELQKNHYEDVVSRRSNWQLVNIYADEGISGTSLQHRDAFIQMIKDCKEGKIDLIVTKSVSRFARNVLDCIGYIRELKALTPPVGVFFETENIYTLNPNSEMSLSFISTLAQEESHTKSEIMNASIEMRFKRGIFLTPPLLGYDQDENGNLVINEEEARTVRLIFFMYLYGYSVSEIAGTLTELGLKTKKGNTNWTSASIYQILQNEKHCGDVLARKTFTPNYLDHKPKKNRQDRNQYRKKDDHEAIVSRDDFIAVQRKLGAYNGGSTAYLPKLSVITEGILRGFVLINPRWAGFKPEDYIQASDQVDEPEEESDLEIEADEGEFDLRGYEIVRGQFFNVHQEIRMIVSHGKIKFSTPCFSKLGFPECVEILIHPKKKLFAVRIAAPESKNKYQWLRKIGERRIYKMINGKPFLPSVYALLGWNKSFQYIINGSLSKKDGEVFLLFDTADMEAIIPKADISIDKEKGMQPFSSPKGIRAYPGTWGDTFGKDYYSHAYDQLESRRDASDSWNISSAGVVLGEVPITPTDNETLHEEINRIVKEVKENDGRV